MITRLAVSGYRSLRNLTVELGSLTIVTGTNGSGKSSLYRSLRLLSEAAQGRLIASLAFEGGFTSTLWAGPEKISADMMSGKHEIQGTVRSGPIALKLGFSGENSGYSIDLGPSAGGGPFGADPEIKVEAMWTGELLERANLFAERRGRSVRLRRSETGEWRTSMDDISSFDSMVTHCADPDDGLELMLMREQMRDWRFYDNLRTDQDAPARRPQIATYTPVLASDGADLAAAIATINAIGDDEIFADAIDDAFLGSRVSIAGGDYAKIQMHQVGLLRPLAAAELSDGTLRYLLLCAALLSPRPPELMVLNEPESSLHPSLMPALARLLAMASTRCQIVVVSHNRTLVRCLNEAKNASEIMLEKEFGQTAVQGELGPSWNWPTR